MVQYHDEEWGVPQHDDRALFELLILEGAQAGLSWDTILRRREGYRRAFDGFEVDTVAGYGEGKVAELLHDSEIIRNQLKVRAAIKNARCVQTIRSEFGSFDAYLWRFVGGSPQQNSRRELSDVPAETAESRTLSADLKKRGCSFVGPTICYAYMQAAGLVNDHLVNCFRYAQLGESREPVAER